MLGGLCEDENFVFRHVKFEVLVKHRDRDVQLVIQNIKQAEEGVQGQRDQQILVETMQVDEFTKEKNRNRRRLETDPMINMFLQESKVNSSGTIGKSDWRGKS